MQTRTMGNTTAPEESRLRSSMSAAEKGAGDIMAVAYGMA